MAALETKRKEQEKAEKEKMEKEVEGLNEKINGLTKLHEQEVTNVFEDEKTLAFIQKMRDFKKVWQQNK